MEDVLAMTLPASWILVSGLMAALEAAAAAALLDSVAAGGMATMCSGRGFDGRHRDGRVKGMRGNKEVRHYISQSGLGKPSTDIEYLEDLRDASIGMSQPWCGGGIAARPRVEGTEGPCRGAIGSACPIGSRVWAAPPSNYPSTPLSTIAGAVIEGLLWECGTCSMTFQRWKP